MRSDRFISELVDENKAPATNDQPTLEDIEKIITNKITKRLDEFQVKIDALTAKGENKDEQSNVNRQTDEGSGSIDIREGEERGDGSEVHPGSEQE